MKIYIPTRGRAQQQITYRQLPPSLQAQTTLVIDPTEKHLYNGATNLLICPPTARSIGPVRQFICDWHLRRYPQQPQLLMLDDDLRFSARRLDAPDKFRPA